MLVATEKFNVPLPEPGVIPLAYRDKTILADCGPVAAIGCSHTDTAGTAPRHERRRVGRGNGYRQPVSNWNTVPSLFDPPPVVVP